MMQAIDLKDCDVYSYQSDLEADPFGEHTATSCCDGVGFLQYSWVGNVTLLCAGALVFCR